MPKYTSKSKSSFHFKKDYNRSDYNSTLDTLSLENKYNIINEKEFMKIWKRENIHYYETMQLHFENEEVFLQWGKDNYQIKVKDFLSRKIPKKYEKFLSPNDDPEDFLVIYKGFYNIRPENIDFENFSVYWTSELDEAKFIDWTGNDGSVVVALIHKKDIDWLRTLIRNTDYGGYTEEEVTLNLMKSIKNSSLIPIAILDKKFRFKENTIVKIPKKGLVIKEWSR